MADTYNMVSSISPPIMEIFMYYVRILMKTGKQENAE